MNPDPVMESPVLRPDLGSPARCLSHRLRRAHADLPRPDDGRIRPLVHRRRACSTERESREAAGPASLLAASVHR